VFIYVCVCVFVCVCACVGVCVHGCFCVYLLRVLESCTHRGKAIPPKLLWPGMRLYRAEEEC
jgi:hypothetical protein